MQASREKWRTAHSRTAARSRASTSVTAEASRATSTSSGAAITAPAGSSDESTTGFVDASTRTPMSGRTTSTRPPRARAMTGVPHIAPSTATRPNGSSHAGVTNNASLRPTTFATSSGRTAPRCSTSPPSRGAISASKYAASLTGPTRASRRPAIRAASIARCGAFSGVIRPTQARRPSSAPGPRTKRDSSTPFATTCRVSVDHCAARAFDTATNRDAGEARAAPSSIHGNGGVCNVVTTGAS